MDVVGFILLVVWVGSLQIMLDEGKDLDWFASEEIRIMAIVAVIGFVSFLIWELTEEHPIVNLRVFRHRGFSASMFVLALAFGSFFGLNVLTPMWLQTNMGYTTTWAGIVVAWGGLLSVVFSPIAANLSNRVDPRWLVFIGCAWLGGDTLWRAVANTDMDYFSICLPLFVMGVGMPMYYIPITGLAMGSVDENEMASAAGLMNFVRTIAGAFATSLVTTFWQDGRYIAHDQLSSIVDPTGDAARIIDGASGSTGLMVRELFDNMVTGQSMQLSTNGLMLSIAVIFFISAFAIALAPKPTRTVDAASVGH
jgi:DHA2 family multidrug resistance protein